MTGRQAVYSVLGPLEVVLPDGQPLAVGGPKQRELLALLLLHRGRPVGPDRLATVLWGDRPGPGADATLRSHVSHLRRRFAGTPLAGSLTTGPAGYVLSVDGADVDADRFELLLGLAQEAWGLGRADRAAELAAEALALWRGRPWPELEHVEAAVADGARLEELRLVTEEVAAEAGLALGRHTELVGRLESLVAEHPFRERFCALLMRALYRAGRQTDALAAYDGLRQRLADELGLDPGPELQQVSLAVLRQDHELLGEPPAAARPPASTRAAGVRRLGDAVLAALAEHPLVGREQEWDTLDAVWADVTAGAARVVLVAGEAGMGKTRLVAELARRATDTGGIVLVGRCGGTEAAYQPVAEALRDSAEVQEVVGRGPVGLAETVALLVGRTAGDEPARGGRPALAGAVRSVLEQLTLNGPVLLVVEDAERIDRASALVLGDLARRLPPRIGLVVGYRDPPGARHAPLGELLVDPAVGRLGERLVLHPLDDREVAALVEQVAPGAPPDLAGRLWRHAGGNPYFTSELARAVARFPAPDGGAWPLPAGVREALRHRLAALDDRTRTVLATAGVLGAQVEYDVLADVVPCGEDELVAALDEAVAGGFLVEAGESWVGSYAFPHELMREASRLEVPAPQLRRMHVRAAEAWRTRVGDRDRGSAPVARHLRAAGPAADPAETAAWCLAAAREARSLYAWDEAFEHADAAVRLLEDGPRDEFARAAMEAASLRLRSGRGFDRVVSLLEAALDAYVGSGDDAAAGHAHSRLGSALVIHHSVMDVPRALEHLEAAERLLPEAPTTYHLQRGRNQAAMLGLRNDVLLEAAGRAAGIAERAGRRDLAVTAGWAEAWGAFNAGRLAEADETAERAWRAAHESADPYLAWIAVQAPAMRANCHLLDPATARSWCRRGLGHPRLAGLAHSHSTVVDLLGLAMALQGDLASAREVTEGLPGSPVARRYLDLLAGDWEAACASFVEAGDADEAAGDLNDAAVNRRGAAWAMRLLGDRAGAAAALEQVLAIGAAGPQVPTEVAARAELARLVAAEDPASAGRHLARCEELMAGEEWRGLAGAVEVARGALAAATGDRSGVDAAAARAVAVFAAAGLPWHRVDALAAWAGHLAAFDESAAARRRAETEAAYRSLGAAPRWTARDARPASA